MSHADFDPLMADCWFVAVWLFGISMYPARHIRILLNPEREHILIHVFILLIMFHISHEL